MLTMHNWFDHQDKHTFSTVQEAANTRLTAAMLRVAMMKSGVYERKRPVATNPSVRCAAAICCVAQKGVAKGSSMLRARLGVEDHACLG
jgi:hypothetical protein